MILTRSSIDVAGRRARALEWEGRRVRVYDSAMLALRIGELLADEQVDAYYKRELMESMLVVDVEAARAALEDFDGFLAHAAWEVAGVDMDGSHAAESDGPQVIDWEQDAGHIQATLWQVYGRSFEEIAPRVSLRQLGGLIGACPHETPMGQAVYYRTAKEPKHTKYNSEEVKRFRRLRAHWAIRGAEGAGAARSKNDQMTDMANAFKRMARRAGA
ncbi:hypothetical protein GMI70_06900 [Eggerthellaceae bacterium zg-893]|nr:hypothetical protein [Eggerthellaceae bacterium zg-893]